MGGKIVSFISRRASGSYQVKASEPEPHHLVAEVERTMLMVQHRVVNAVRATDDCYKQLEESAGEVLGGVVCRIQKTRSRLERLHLFGD
jgi:hypothetical protein